MTVQKGISTRCLRTWSAFVALAAVLLSARAARANSIAPTAMFYPGFLPVMGVAFALPASVLAAFIERPFFRLAGVVNRPLRISLRANFVSLVIGFLAAIPGMMLALYLIGPLWLLLAVCLSIWIEGVVARDWVREPRQFVWGWIVLGNLISSIVLILVPHFAMWLKLKGWEWDWDWCQSATTETLSYRMLYWGAMTVSAAAFIWSFRNRFPTSSDQISDRPEQSCAANRPNLGENPVPQ